MLRLHQRSFQPRTQTAGFIEWDPRAFNALADEAANKALDRGESWLVVHPEGVRRARGGSEPVNFRLCFDGARRGDGSAAAGVAMLAYYASGERELLLRGGMLLGTLTSAFVAEALAAEWCFDVFFSKIVDI